MNNLRNVISELIYDSQMAVFYFRKLNYARGICEYQKILSDMDKFIELISEQKYSFVYNVIDENGLLNMLSNLAGAFEVGDYQFVSDILQMQLIGCISLINEIEGVMYEPKCNYDKWLIEPTSCGYVTCKYRDKYVHSNYPIEQAISIADTWLEDGYYKYIVYGLGMGYHIDAMLRMDENIEVDVYEENQECISIARECGCLNRLEKTGRVRIFQKDVYQALSRKIRQLDNSTKFVIYEPSLQLIGNKEFLHWLEEYFVDYSSFFNQKRRLEYSFMKNIQLNSPNVDAIKDKIQGKNVYIIAAGPSLDNNYMELKKVGDSGVIIATGTVLGKLIRAGIYPDYFIITDTNDSTYPQIKGVEECKIPLLYLSTAYNKVVQDYKGEKYIILQKGYKRSESFAQAHNNNLYNTGGSVTTTAVDIAIQMGCKRLIGVGMDFAYTSGLDHARETPFVKEVSKSLSLREVEDVNGNIVNTTKVLDIYRKWIEERISWEISLGTDIEFIDATEGGAKIKGMKLMKLSECVENFR